jgi:hypothetical protein
MQFKYLCELLRILYKMNLAPFQIKKYMERLISFVVLLLVLFLNSCNRLNKEENSKVDLRLKELEKELTILKKYVEFKDQVSFTDSSAINEYRWFRLGDSYYSYVNDNFIVQAVKSEFKNNGYEITGLVTNVLSLSTTQAKVIGAILDSSKEKKVITGSVEIPILNPGEKTDFTLFIPTSQTNVERVGVKIKSGRM